MSFFYLGAETPGATNWAANLQVDEVLNDSDKSFTVPSDKEWLVQSIHAEFTSTPVSNDRQMEVQIQDSGSDVVAVARAGAVQAASITRNYEFGPGLADLTAFFDGDLLTTPMRSIVLPSAFKVRVFDNNAVDPGPLGADLVTNGGFDTDTDWAKGTGWTIASGVASSDGSQGGDADLTEALGLTNGVAYEVTFTVSNYSAGNVTAVCGGTEGTDRGANGTFTEKILAGAGGDFDIRADLNFVGDIDDVSVKDAGDDMIVQLLVLERNAP